MCSPGGQQQQQANGYYNYPRRPVGLYTASGEPMNNDNFTQQVATPSAWEQQAVQNVERSTPLNPSIADYVAYIMDEMGPRIRYEDASNGTHNVLNRGSIKEKYDENLQRVWSK